MEGFPFTYHLLNSDKLSGVKFTKFTFSYISFCSHSNPVLEILDALIYETEREPVLIQHMKSDTRPYPTNGLLVYPYLQLPAFLPHRVPTHTGPLGAKIDAPIGASYQKAPHETYPTLFPRNPWNHSPFRILNWFKEPQNGAVLQSEARLLGSASLEMSGAVHLGLLRFLFFRVGVSSLLQYFSFFSWIVFFFSKVLLISKRGIIYFLCFQ